MMQKQQKRHFRAYWLLPSFERSQFRDMDLVLYTGVHKPRQKGTRDMPEVKEDPEAFLPKADVSVSTFHNTYEAFPIYAREVSALIAGITMLDKMNDDGSRKTIMEKSIAMMRIWMNARSDLSGVPYREFDPNNTSYSNMIDIASKHGPPMKVYDLSDPMRRQKNMLWLKGAHVLMKRPSRDKRATFYRDMLMIGKDVIRNEVVIGMKKSLGNIARIIPLHAGGLYFLTSIRYMTEIRPSKYPVITGATLERLVEEKIHCMKDMDMVACDLSIKASDVIRRLGMEDD